MSTSLTIDSYRIESKYLHLINVFSGLDGSTYFQSPGGGNMDIPLP